MSNDVESLLRPVAPLLPVLVVERVDAALRLAELVQAAGGQGLELCLRTPAALDALQAVRRAFPELILGAGSVVSPAQMQRVARWVDFVVTPGLVPELIEAAQGCELPLLPGVMTPSEVLAAQLAGFRLVKLFPAEEAGGVDYLARLAGPFPDMRFCPTGGLNVEKLGAYLAEGNVPLVGGSWLAPLYLQRQEDWDSIGRRMQEAYTRARQRCGC